MRQVVFLEEQPQLEISPDSLDADSTWIVDHQDDSVLIGTKCTQNRILVLTDNYFDAWHVFVDGEPAKLLRAYGTFRAVTIPAGTKTVLFKYKSKRYIVGKKITVLTSLFLLLIIGFYYYVEKIRHRKRKELTT